MIVDPSSLELSLELNTAIVIYLMSNMIDGTCKLNGSNIEFIDNLVEVILSPRTRMELTVCPNEAIDIVELESDNFIILTPVIYLQYLVFDGEVFAILHPLTPGKPTVALAEAATVSIILTGSTIINDDSHNVATTTLQ